MADHRLTDEQWQLIEYNFRRQHRIGRPPVDPRKMIDAILWRCRTRSPWRDLPDEFGSWHTVYNNFDKWCADGTLDEIEEQLQEWIGDDDGVDTNL